MRSFTNNLRITPTSLVAFVLIVAGLSIGSSFFAVATPSIADDHPGSPHFSGATDAGMCYSRLVGGGVGCVEEPGARDAPPPLVVGGGGALRVVPDTVGLALLVLAPAPRVRVGDRLERRGHQEGSFAVTLAVSATCYPA